MQMGDDPDQGDEVRPISPFEFSVLSLFVFAFWAVVLFAVSTGWWVCLRLFR